MQREHIFALALGSIAIVTGMTAGDAASGAAQKNHGIYYRTQAAADAALAAFDKANPSCQLWTNWQKMCSRTGAKGAMWCRTDPERPVKPSKVFCSKAPNSYGLIQERELTPAQISRDRFCTSSENRSPLAKRLGRSVCVDMDIDRPFSGHRISSRLHPWCIEWKNKDSLSVVRNEKAFATLGYYCSKKAVPKWCPSADGFGNIPVNSPDHPKFGSSEILVLGIIDYAMNSPVVGITCELKHEI